MAAEDGLDARRRRLTAVAHAHAEAEGRRDMGTTLATLQDDPVYELQPVGRTFSGMEAVRAYYSHFFENFLPLAESSELRSEWVTDEGVGQEYVIGLRLPDGSRERHCVIGILVFGADRLAGERLYASERLFRLMCGPIYDEAE